MRVRQLIEALIADCDMDATVYVAGGGEGDIADRDWDGGAMSITSDHDAVFIHFNESGMYNYIDTEYAGG